MDTGHTINYCVKHTSGRTLATVPKMDTFGCPEQTRDQRSPLFRHASRLALGDGVEIAISRPLICLPMRHGQIPQPWPRRLHPKSTGPTELIGGMAGNCGRPESHPSSSPLHQSRSHAHLAEGYFRSASGVGETCVVARWRPHLERNGWRVLLSLGPIPATLAKSLLAR